MKKFVAVVLTVGIGFGLNINLGMADAQHESLPFLLNRDLRIKKEQVNQQRKVVEKMEKKLKEQRVKMTELQKKIIVVRHARKIFSDDTLIYGDFHTLYQVIKEAERDYLAEEALAEALFGREENNNQKKMGLAPPKTNPRRRIKRNRKNRRYNIAHIPFTQEKTGYLQNP